MGFDTILGEVEAAIAHVFVGSPMFLYGAGFENANMVPFHDPFGLGNLQPVTSGGTPGPNTTIEFLPVSMRFAHGAARLRMERRGSVAEKIAFGLVLPTLPTYLQTFRIMATCTMPTGPHGASDTWAVVVHAREPSVDETDNRDKKILVTLQSAWNAPTPGAKMNTPLPTPNAGAGPWLPQDIFDLLFPAGHPPSPTQPPTEPEPAPLVSQPVFTLQLDVDRAAASGHATLYVKAPGSGFIVDPGPGYALAHMQGRDFVHPFMSALDANGSPNVIAAAGVHLAITANGGDGPVSVTVEDFMIFGTRDAGLLGALAEASLWPASVKQVLGEVRSRLTHWSFGRAAKRMAKSRPQ